MGYLIIELLVEALFSFVTNVIALHVVERRGEQAKVTHYPALITEKPTGEYLLRFATAEGEKLLKVTPTDYAHLSPWQKGIVTVQGGAYRSFKPTGKTNLPEIVAHYRKKAADAPTHVA